MADNVVPKRLYLGIHQPEGQRGIRRPKRVWESQF